MTRGGKREGAGRKPRQVPKVPFTVRLEPDVKAMMDEIRKLQCLSQSGQVALLIKERYCFLESVGSVGKWKNEKVKI